MMENIKEGWEMMKNTKEYWELMGNIKECWELIGNIKECWEMMGNVEEWWEMMWGMMGNEKYLEEYLYPLLEDQLQISPDSFLQFQFLSNISFPIQHL